MIASAGLDPNNTTVTILSPHAAPMPRARGGIFYGFTA